MDTDNDQFEREKINALKDHELRDLVNSITEIARRYSNTQQLRCRISGAIIGVLRPFKDRSIPKHCNGVEEIEELLECSDQQLPHLHVEKQKPLLTEGEIDQIAFTSYEGDGLEQMLQFSSDCKNVKTNGEMMALIARFRKQTRVCAINTAMETIRLK